MSWKKEHLGSLIGHCWWQVKSASQPTRRVEAPGTTGREGSSGTYLYTSLSSCQHAGCLSGVSWLPSPGRTWISWSQSHCFTNVINSRSGGSGMCRAHSLAADPPALLHSLLRVRQHRSLPWVPCTSCCLHQTHRKDGLILLSQRLFPPYFLIINFSSCPYFGRGGERHQADGVSCSHALQPWNIYKSSWTHTNIFRYKPLSHISETHYSLCSVRVIHYIQKQAYIF